MSRRIVPRRPHRAAEGGLPGRQSGSTGLPKPCSGLRGVLVSWLLSRSVTSNGTGALARACWLRRRLLRFLVLPGLFLLLTLLLVLLLVLGRSRGARALLPGGIRPLPGRIIYVATRFHRAVFGVRYL